MDFDEIYINGDYNRLKQVLVNLIKNSVEAINSRNGEIEVSLKEKKDEVIICVKDNGIGMDYKVLSRCGEPFFTTKENGTGLGVGLSKEIMKMHKGSLKYSSRVNYGTKATMILQKNTK